MPEASTAPASSPAPIAAPSAPAVSPQAQTASSPQSAEVTAQARSADIAKVNARNAQRDASLTAAAEAAIAGKSKDEIAAAQEKARKGEKQAPTAKPEATKTPQGQPDANLSEADQQVLRRLQMQADELPTDPELRTKRLAHLRQRVADQDRLGNEKIAAEARANALAQEVEQLKAKAATPPVPPKTEPVMPPLAPDKAWEEVTAKLKEVGLDDAIPALQKAVEAAVAAQVGQVNKQLAPLVQQQEAARKAADARKSQDMQRAHAMMQEDFQRNFTAAELPAEIDKSDAKVSDAIRDIAFEIIRSKAIQRQKNPNLSNTMKEAVTEAHALAEIRGIVPPRKNPELAAREKLAASQRAIAGSSPDRGTAASSAPKTNRDQRLEAAARAAIEGRGAEAARREFQGAA